MFHSGYLLCFRYHLGGRKLSNHPLQASVIRKIIYGAFGLTVIIATALLVKVPGDSIVSDEFQNAAHTLAFSIITLITLITLNVRTARTPLTTGLAICTSILALGLFIECAQWLIGRGFSPLDLLRNLAGVGVGGILYSAFTLSAHRKRIALGVAGLLLIGSFVPTAGFMLSNTMRPKPPILADFEQWGVLHRMRSTGAITQIDHNESLWPANHTFSARVQFQSDREWPSVLFAEVNPEWQNYDQLRFKVINTQATALRLYIRVDNQDSGPETEIRMTVSRTINPGTSVITIPLAEFRQQAEKSDPPGHPSMSRITNVVFFLRRQEESRTLLFDDVELTNENLTY